LCALAKMSLGLGEAQEQLIRAIVRVSDRMNARNVAKTFWALALVEVQPGAAHACLLQQVPRVSSELNMSEVQQIRHGLEWLQKKGYGGEVMQAALHSIGACNTDG
jgi:hypothetical protein